MAAEQTQHNMGGPILKIRPLHWWLKGQQHALDLPFFFRVDVRNVSHRQHVSEVTVSGSIPISRSIHRSGNRDEQGEGRNEAKNATSILTHLSERQSNDDDKN